MTEAISCCQTPASIPLESGTKTELIGVEKKLAPWSLQGEKTLHPKGRIALSPLRSHIPWNILFTILLQSADLIRCKKNFDDRTVRSRDRTFSLSPPLGGVRGFAIFGPLSRDNGQSDSEESENVILFDL